MKKSKQKKEKKVLKNLGSYLSSMFYKKNVYLFERKINSFQSMVSLSRQKATCNNF